MRIELDCRNMVDKPAAHAYLKQMLSLPEYYGNNLDALYDVLTERREDVSLVLLHWRQLGAQMGAYGMSLLETLRQASEENPKLEVILADDA